MLNYAIHALLKRYYDHKFLKNTAEQLKTTL